MKTWVIVSCLLGLLTSVPGAHAKKESEYAKNAFFEELCPRSGAGAQVSFSHEELMRHQADLVTQLASAGIHSDGGKIALIDRVYVIVVDAADKGDLNRIMEVTNTLSFPVAHRIVRAP